MKQLVEAKDKEIFWEQPKVSQRNFFLRSEEATFGQLEFNSSFSTMAVATLGDVQWTLKRVGFFSTRITIRQAGSVVDFATYHPKWTGSQGLVRFASGEEYTWNVANFMSTRYTFSRTGGLELITYLSGSRTKKFPNIFKQDARVSIAPDAWLTKELPILVLLGWYLVILQNEDSSAVAVTASYGML